MTAKEAYETALAFFPEAHADEIDQEIAEAAKEGRFGIDYVHTLKPEGVAALIRHYTSRGFFIQRVDGNQMDRPTLTISWSASN